VLSDELKKEVLTAYEKWDRAFNAADAKALAASYTHDATCVPPTRAILSGSDKIENFFAGLIATGVTNHALEAVEVGGSKDVPYCVAKWTASGKNKDGSPRDLAGVATHIFARGLDGALRVKVHNFY
jgi:uncharacterized protein (TIGR02246 family)